MAPFPARACRWATTPDGLPVILTVFVQARVRLGVADGGAGLQHVTTQALHKLRGAARQEVMAVEEGGIRHPGASVDHGNSILLIQTCEVGIDFRQSDGGIPTPELAAFRHA